MVEDVSVSVLYNAFVAARSSSFPELAAVYDHDHQPLQDWDYPAVSIDWDDTSPVRFAGNFVEGEVHLMVSLYEADGHPPDAHRRLRGMLRKFERVILSARSRPVDGYVFTFHPGATKPGQRLGDSTYTAAAFCRVTVKFRGPI